MIIISAEELPTGRTRKSLCFLEQRSASNLESRTDVPGELRTSKQTAV